MFLMQNHRRTTAKALLAASSVSLVTVLAPHAALAAESSAKVEADVPTTSPTITGVDELKGALSVSWNAPSSESQIVAYHVLATRGVDGSGNPVVKGQQVVPADVRETTISGLTNGNKYDLYVFPITVAGYGLPSTPASGTPNAEGDGAVVPTDIGVDVTKGAGFLTASWDAPEWDGGSAVVGYSVIVVDQAGNSLAAWRNVGADVRNTSITGLKAGHTYDVYVAANNAKGIGELGDPTHVQIVSGSTTAPAKPTMSWASAIASGDNAVVSWGPADEHGQSTTKYDVVVTQNGAMTAWKVTGANARQAIVPLADGDPATILVIAESSSGMNLAEGAFVTLSVAHA
jgi:hypothetical protein